MTHLEQIEHRISLLLLQYEDRKNDPTYKLQLSLLATERSKLMTSNEITPPDDECLTLVYNLLYWR